MKNLWPAFAAMILYVAGAVFLVIQLKSVIAAAVLGVLGVLLIAAFALIDCLRKRELREKQTQVANMGRNAALAEMVSGIVHEANQPLCVIRGYFELLEVLLDGHPVLEENDMGKMFQLGTESVDRVNGILNHMRSFVKSDLNDKRTVELAEPVEDALKFFNRQMMSHNIAVEKDFQENLPKVVLNPLLFEQVVVNLISNIRYFLDLKGESDSDFEKRMTLKIYAVPDRSAVVFEAGDNGPGMPPGILKLCIKPFFTTKSDGAGLGLAIAKEIIEELGGKLDIESQPGKGSTFRVTVPVAN